MQQFLNKLGLAISLLQQQRAIESKQYEDREDYAISVSSAHTFFDSFEFYLRQYMAAAVIDTDQKASVIFDSFFAIAQNALIATLIDHGRRFPKKRWYNVFR